MWSEQGFLEGQFGIFGTVLLVEVKWPFRTVGQELVIDLVIDYMATREDRSESFAPYQLETIGLTVHLDLGDDGNASLGRP